MEFIIKKNSKSARSCYCYKSLLRIIVRHTADSKRGTSETFCKQVFSDNVWALKKMAVTDF